MRLGSATRLANAPCVCGMRAAEPRYVPAGLRLGRSDGYGADPSSTSVAGCTATRAPAAGPLPSAAAVSTVPTISCPSTLGSRRIDWPAAPCSQ